MTARLRLFILATAAVATICVAAAILFFPLGPVIVDWRGLAFWSGMTFVASALPVRMPRGTLLSSSFATLMAALLLGGPLAAVVVAVIGTFDTREIRGRVPWYGMLNDHSIFAIAAFCAGLFFVVVRHYWDQAFGPNPIFDFVVFLVASGVYYAINTVLAVGVVHLRTGVPFTTIWLQDIRGITASLFALAPLAWLMAQIFQLPNGVGWWATPLFVVPLFTTRLAYSRYVETRELFEQTIAALANAVDARDRYTRGHSNRVSHISEAMCRVMHLPEDEVERIKWAGLLHDIGKIGIRDNILLKEGPLTREERVLMNQHPTIGAEIVAPASQLSKEAPLIRAHHEWINGSGYPDGLEALDIPLGARIMTIADAYEAMTSSRPYRKTPLTHEQAVEQLEKFSGIQFDPEIVPILVGLDRETLDRRGSADDALPTMLHQEDPRDVPVAQRPVLASDDVP